ncbi:MAG: 2,3-diaminopropionate biosynthesis protein SbnB, partial [Kibdelosporangium sp.]
MVYSQVCRVPSFAVLSGNQVRRALHGRERRVLEIVEAAYRAHGAGAGGGVHVDGLRWAGSAGDAPAMLVLNDRETGYPFACMEGSIISAVRTAALAVLAAGRLSRGRGRLRRLGFAGLGSVAQYVYSYLIATGWRFDEIRGFDRADRAAGAFRSYVERRGGRVRSGS